MCLMCMAYCNQGKDIGMMDLLLDAVVMETARSQSPDNEMDENEMEPSTAGSPLGMALDVPASLSASACPPYFCAAPVLSGEADVVEYGYCRPGYAEGRCTQPPRPARSATQVQEIATALPRKHRQV